ncbi:hypothetical protein BDY19DRAFT_910553 [Irpex rosettiformis]|uniref:Uncharacterized protein n=1 Tax=Irpex rosettiformis TaxID=378272 RepID=A0ACB8TN96_9APHY|nr:hypothetical protein BDY19DRAFT_910553 [Irpex rosettiformis]
MGLNYSNSTGRLVFSLPRSTCVMKSRGATPCATLLIVDYMHDAVKRCEVGLKEMLTASLPAHTSITLQEARSGTTQSLPFHQTTRETHLSKFTHVTSAKGLKAVHDANFLPRMSLIHFKLQSVYTRHARLLVLWSLVEGGQLGRVNQDCLFFRSLHYPGPTSRCCPPAL